MQADDCASWGALTAGAYTDCRSAKGKDFATQTVRA